ncbi:DNA translocase FtsK [Cricetibacter osteomyelitidis]|uniref:DNA translocase FtsK n=1 Tax=Cricetibacter osteomyelitidis TaxID=1521931 RepID=A0A4R2TF69_9PAST|nr:DNA translocase FtsK [Cricetibacter osteomyelitidis]TCP95828.1 DNA translocase FtsK [Cricetibacter osteomyelitidis]
MIERIKRFTPKQYLVEFLLGVMTLFGLYLVIAWAGYSPLDNAWSVSSYQTETINKAGALGAWIIDLFFSLFGRVGNLIPFVLFIAPIYFIRSKRADYLSWSQVGVFVGGFCLLLLGLTTLSSLSLPGAVDYLAGGTLGGIIANFLVPMLNKFGVILLALVLSGIGFMLCSGTALINFMMKVYRWLMIKNEPESEKKKELQVPQELEEITAEEITLDPLVHPLPASQITEKDETDEQNIGSNNDDEDDELVNIENFTKPEIFGLSPAVRIDEDRLEANSVIDQSMKAPLFNGYNIEQNTALPIVTIVTDESKNLSENLPHLSQREPQILSPNDIVTVADVQQITSNNAVVNEVMPTVKLAMANNTPMYDFNDDETDQSEHGYLAEQFKAQEQQKLRELESRAKAMGEQDVLKVILPQENKSSEIAEPVKKQPEYKPYENTLLHPLLQPTPVNIIKPTTPLPSVDLLEKMPVQTNAVTEQEIIGTSHKIEQQLRNFKVNATVKDVLVGPVVTRYELELQAGVKASKVTSIETDLARALTFKAIRVAEVIPGKPYIGLETPNRHRQIVPLRDVLDCNEFSHSNALLPMALGKDISGKPVVIDLAKTPHLLVAGSTGSGKSVGVNTMILSLLFKLKPEQMKFIMIDPKVVELSIYDGIPHLLTPVVTDMKKAANALRWCVEEMERRYLLLAALRVRNIEGYNEKIDEAAAMNLPIPNPIWKPGDTMDTLPPALEKLSYIVVIVDEFADLMMVAGKQVEEFIARIAQKARAVGIHLILATQRPSVDVITGLIKANIPSRIAFTVASKIDSRTILDQGGAESLLGKGDMLYSGQGSSDLIRIHGAFMSDAEVGKIADEWRARGKPEYIDSILEFVDEDDMSGGDDDFVGNSDDELDPLFDKAVEIVVSTGMTSTSFLQRRLKVGFNRAANIMEQLEMQGIVSEMRNGKRELLSRTPVDY